MIADYGMVHTLQEGPGRAGYGILIPHYLAGPHYIMRVVSYLTIMITTLGRRRWAGMGRIGASCFTRRLETGAVARWGIPHASGENQKGLLLSSPI